MTALRCTAWLVLVVLLLAPVLGFADGDRALEMWNQHPRHASTHVGAPHGIGKTPPAATMVSRPRPVVVLVGLGVVDPLAPLPRVSARPPFVPPRA